MNDVLSHWLARKTGVDTASGEGTFWSLDYSWGWPPWLTLLGIALIVAAVIAIYLREGDSVGRRFKLFLAGLRLAALGLVLLMIAQLAVSRQRTGLPCVAVLVDDSLSMTIVDPYDPPLRASLDERMKQAGFTEPSRWNLARTLLSENNAAQLREMARRYRLRLYYVSGAGAGAGAATGASTPVEPLLHELRTAQAAGESTRLGIALRTILNDLRGHPPAAIVILSDGINTDGPTLSEAAAEAHRRGVPLLCVGLGDDRPVRRLRLGDLLVDKVVFVDDVVTFQFRLSGTGLAGYKVPITLRQEGRGDVLARLEATVGPDGQTQTLQLSHRPTQVGRFRYTVEAVPPEGIPPGASVRQQAEIEVRKARIRVLLAQADPSFEFRYLRNLLARDETIELSTLLQDADWEHAEDDPRALRIFPVGREELFAYDVVILGDVNPALLSESNLRNLADFVTQKGKGGALVAIAGPKYMPLGFRNTPLAPLLPVELATARCPPPDRTLSEGFVVRPTALGLASPAMQLGDTREQTLAIWKGLPPLYWMLAAPQLKPGARVLAEHPSAQGDDGRPLPLVVLQYVGAGQVLLHATDETWRWRRGVGDVFFARYWIQTLRALARSKLAADSAAELSTDRAEYALGEPVALRVRFADERLAPPEDDGVTVVLEHAGHRTLRVRLQRTAGERGIFEALHDNASAGRYHAWVAIPALEGRAPAADFSVVAPPDEMEQTRMDAAELQRAAEQTNGHFYTFATAGSLVDDLPAVRPVTIESLPPTPLWNQWPLFVLLVVLLSLEWILRKYVGLV